MPDFAKIFAVFRIRDILVQIWDILVRIRICGSIPLTNGSGSQKRRNQGFSYYFLLDARRTRIRISEAQTPRDPEDPDPEHLFFDSTFSEAQNPTYTTDPDQEHLFFDSTFRRLVIMKGF
jgi:hypothetical protein